MFEEKCFASRPADQAKRGVNTHATNFRDILRTRAAKGPHKQAFVFLDSRGAIADELTFGALDCRAHAIATELIVNGLSGERALLVFPPGLDFVAALCACFYAGVVAVPIPFLSGKRITERISAIRHDADPAAVLTLGRLREDPQLCEGAFGVADQLAWVPIDVLQPEPRDVSLPMLGPDTLALLQYTSGSTNSPKGVMLSHSNLIANSRMIAEAFGHDETSRGVGWLPQFHDMGLVGHVLQPVYFGGVSVLMSPLSFLQRPVRWLQAISAWKATTSGGPTYAFELCLRAVRDEQLGGVDLSSWRVAYCGSERVHADILDRFCTRFSGHGFRRQSLLPCYGLAEATLLVTGARCETGLRTAGPADRSSHLRPAVSCGPPACSSSVVVADPNTRAKLNDGTVGEIWVEGPHIGQGYWCAGNGIDDPFRASLADGSGPYLRTGDLGFIQAGQLFVTGRIKDTIIINGLKHSAEDIEVSATRSHELFVGFASAAFGIDVCGQERAVLAQEVRREQLKSEIAEAIASAFASVTREHSLRLFDLALVRVGSLPRTSSGKVQRSRVRDIYLANGFERLNPPGSLFQANPLAASQRTAELDDA